MKTKNQVGKIEMVAKTLLGLENLLAFEINELGGQRVEILNRAVRFYGDMALLYRANLYLRTALRILLPVVNTHIEKQEDLYNRLRDIEWEKYIRIGNTLAIDTFLSSKIFTHSHFVSLRTKDAIADRFRDKYRRRPSVNTKDPDILINVHLSGNDLTVSVDTSGVSLHKRGYRIAEFVAPINEVLAAGMIMLTGWKGETNFYDPMCGSGTIGIEAALIAREIPPGVFRNKFGFENSPDFEKELWTEIYDDIREKEWNCIIHASDISGKAIKLASDNAKRASVLKNINYSKIAFESYPAVKDNGVVVINPPYGERMTKTDIVSFYRMIGNVLKKSFAGTDVWVISADKEALKNIGLRPTVKYKLFNGPLECRYNKFEIYSGSKRNSIG